MQNPFKPIIDRMWDKENFDLPPTPAQREAKLRERFLDAFPSVLGVQLHGFGVEVDEIFDFMVAEIEKARQEVLEALKELKAKDEGGELVHKDGTRCCLVDAIDLLSSTNNKEV